MKSTGASRATSETMCKSTAASAPKLETSALRPSRSSRSTAPSTLFAGRPSKRSPSCSALAERLLCSMGLALLVERGFERGEAQPLHRVEECFRAVLAQGEIGAQEALDRRDDLVIGKARPHALADRRLARVVAAERDLVVL